MGWRWCRLGSLALVGLAVALMLAAFHAGGLGLVDLDAPPAVLLKDVDAAFAQFRVAHARRYVSAADTSARRDRFEAFLRDPHEVRLASRVDPAKNGYDIVLGTDIIYFCNQRDRVIVVSI